MDEDKTDLWLKAPQSAKYSLPDTCPTCQKPLKAKCVYVGIFPYIHADATLVCINDHEFNFCLPFNAVMVEGYTVFDSTESKRYYTDKCCPFHSTQKLTPVRLYGDLVFKDGKRKIQLRCPICNYSERRLFTK
jgi:hypothetical protein